MFQNIVNNFMKSFHKIIITFHIIDFMKIIHKIDNKRKKIITEF